MMVVIHKCAWCKKDILPSKTMDKQTIITHGICESCLIDLEYKRLPLNDVLNKIPIPVLVADIDGNITTANKLAEDALQKELASFQNQRGGNVMECVYSDLPGGCGETIHCSACTIRKTVMKTHDTGENQKDVLAIQYLKTPTGNQLFEILISTQKVGDVVLLHLQQMNPVLKED